MKNTLLCPNQAREHGTIVDNVPQNLDHTGQSTFSVSTSEHALHLQQHGPTACLQLLRPTNEEMDNLDIIDITDEHEWKPYNESHISNHDHFSMLTTTVQYGIDEWLLSHRDWRLYAIHMSKPKDWLTPEYLDQLWKWGIETARKTIEATTCRHYRNKVKGLTKRYRQSQYFMRYCQIRIPSGEFYTDMMLSKVRSIRGHTCAQICGNKFDHIKAYPLENKTSNSWETHFH